MENTKNRLIYIDAMRIIACFLVIFNHLPGYTLYQVSWGGKRWIYMFITMLTRINVPLFFMISGTLLLGREDSYSVLIRKRIRRFLIILVIFEMGLYLTDKILPFLKGEMQVFGWFEFVREMLSGKIHEAGSYWYLYAYLGMLLTLPFLRKISRQLNKNDFVLLLVLHFLISSFLPMVNIVMRVLGMDEFTLSSYFSIPLATTKAFFYPIAGYYIDRFVNIKDFRLREITGLIVVAYIGILLSSVCTYCEGEITGKYTQNYVQLFDYLTTIVAFLLIKYFFVVYKKGVCNIGTKIITGIGALTFGIYLLDPYMKLLFYYKVSRILEPFLPTIIVSGMWCFFSMIIGGGITLILKKIPYIGKLL